MASGVTGRSTASTYYIVEGHVIGRLDSNRQIHVRNYETGAWTLSDDSELNKEILYKGRVITHEYADERFHKVWQKIKQR